MRANRTPGSVREAPGNRCPYLDIIHRIKPVGNDLKSFENAVRRLRWTGLAWLLWLVVAALFVSGSVQPLAADEPRYPAGRANLDTSPDPDHPTRVEVSFFIDDISDIDLNDGYYKITGQMILEWRDPRLAFPPDPQPPGRPKDFNAEAAKELLKVIWDPTFEISNERGQRRTGVFSINIWPDGRVRVYEKFDSVPRFSGDLHLYPYGTIDLDLVMTGFLQDRSEMYFHLKGFEFQNNARPDEFIHGHWTFVGMKAVERAAKRSDDRSVDYSHLHFQVTVAHESFQSGSYQVAISVFVPLLVIFLASSALLWIDPGKTGSYASPRLGGTVTLILATIALKFSLAKQLPGFIYLTLTDVIFLITIMMLVLSLMGSCLYLWLHAERSKTLAITYNRYLRLLYPVLYVVVIALSIHMMIHHPPLIEN